MEPTQPRASDDLTDDSARRLRGAAMAVSGAGSIVFGRLFDHRGIATVVPLTLVSAAYAPPAFLGSVAIGALLTVSIGVVVAVAVLAELAAKPMIPIVRKQTTGSAGDKHAAANGAGAA